MGIQLKKFLSQQNQNFNEQKGVNGFQVHVLHVLNLFKLPLDISAPKWNYFRHYGAILLLFHSF